MLAAPTALRVEPTLALFVDFLESWKIGELDDVTGEAAAEFVQSRLTSGCAASLATQHNRRTAVRALFASARRLGMATGDPTLDLALPAPRSNSSRPLTDEEVERCRDVAWWASSRVAAAWALAEATARGNEIAQVAVEDIDLDAREVHLHGGARTAARTGELSNWATDALRRRLGEVAAGAVAYSGSGASNAGQVSTCRAISSVLVRAGLAGESGVRPASAAGWAGRRVFDTTGRIEDAAQAMGVRSLDRAARLIGLDWSTDA